MMSNRRTSASNDELRQLIEQTQFESMNELQNFLNLYSRARNATPRKEFHGLSPEQMEQMLRAPFDSPSLVHIPEVLDDKPEAPILTLFGLLKEGIGEKGLKATAKGNLPRNFCSEAVLSYWGEERFKNDTGLKRVSREQDFFPLHITRLVAGLAGLVRKHKGRFILSQDCRRLLSRHGDNAIYPKLLRAYVERFNWPYQDGFEDLPLIQNAWLFTLYLFTRYGDTPRPPSFYEEAFTQAFPTLEDQVMPRDYEFFSPVETIRRCFSLRSIVRFAGFLGLASIQREHDSLFSDVREVKALPLLQTAICFQV